MGNGTFCANNNLALCMKIASWVGFDSVSTVTRKAYLTYRAGVRSLHALGSRWHPCKNELMYIAIFEFGPSSYAEPDISAYL